jgi:hypothetical protein
MVQTERNRDKANLMDRQQAWNLLCEFTKTDNLRRHALAVEACVTAYARKFAEDENKWSVTALLHDFDWEIHPELPDHPIKGEPILAERGVEGEIRRAILSHADFTGVPRLLVCEAEPEHPRGGRQIGSKKTEGHSLRAFRQPRRHHQWRTGAGHRIGPAYRILHPGHAAAGSRARPGRHATGRSKLLVLLEFPWKLFLAGAGPGLQNQRGALCVAGGFDPH